MFRLWFHSMYKIASGCLVTMEICWFTLRKYARFFLGTRQIAVVMNSAVLISI